MIDNVAYYIQPVIEKIELIQRDILLICIALILVCIALLAREWRR